ncbi:MAG: hypothetical protein EBS70_05000 [Actinobacteria bacterium]|nr:hypothetical protein [Actinomycetota bacterium]
MSRNIHYVVVQREDGTWFVDNDTADLMFSDGLVYDEKTGEWDKIRADDTPRDTAAWRLLERAVARMNEEK